jgi:hypothetical protein
MVAMGKSNTEISQAIGYTRERISQIIAAPASQAELARLRHLVENKIVSMIAEEEAIDHETLTVAKRQRLDYLYDAEDRGEYIQPRELNAIIADIEDRFGTPKKSTHVNLSANFGSELEAAIQRSEAVEAVRGATLPGKLP